MIASHLRQTILPDTARRTPQTPSLTSTLTHPAFSWKSAASIVALWTSRSRRAW